MPVIAPAPNPAPMEKNIPDIRSLLVFLFAGFIIG